MFRDGSTAFRAPRWAVTTPERLPMPIHIDLRTKALRKRACDAENLLSIGPTSAHHRRNALPAKPKNGMKSAAKNWWS
jgi:hypothetical protein